MRRFFEKPTRRLNTDQSKKLRNLKLPKSAVLNNISGLRSIVEKLGNHQKSVWADYDDNNTYTSEMVNQKMDFVEMVLDKLGGGSLAFDFGANTGRYSRILAKRYELVVAMDSDPGAIDKLFLSLKGSPQESCILPLVMDLMNPSPAQGWRNKEREAFQSRGKPDLAVYLALIHHICLGKGVPLEDFVEMMFSISNHSIVEFVNIDDEMSQTVIANKKTVHDDYLLTNFCALVRERGDILEEKALSETRTLFLIGPKSL